MSAPAPVPHEAAEIVIEVSDLCVSYGRHEVLHDVHLQVRRGEIMVVMGGSGSGKSTLLRALLGLQSPSRGCIRLLGQDITRLGEHAMHELRTRMGVAFQGGALFNSMTVGDNILLPLREHTRLDENTMRIMMRMKLALVGLSGCEDLMPAQLSGGMIKRAALARAIVMDPPLLFFDEPSAGLDPVASAQLDRLILKLRRALNMTIVVVTHELESAFAIADRITVLDRGRVLFTGTPDALRRSEDRRIQDLLQRRADIAPVDPEVYLDKLTGAPPDA